MKRNTLKVQMEDLPNESALDYCRKLITEGTRGNTILEVYRGPMLCLTINPISEGAKLTADGKIFRKYRPST